MQQRVLHIRWKYPARVTQITCSVTVLLFHRWREWQAQIHKIHFNLKNLITHFLIIVTGERRAGSRWPADLHVYSSGIAWQLRFGLLIPLQRDSENRHNPESSISRLSERRWLDFDGSRLQLVVYADILVCRALLVDVLHRFILLDCLYIRTFHCISQHQLWHTMITT